LTALRAKEVAEQADKEKETEAVAVAKEALRTKEREAAAKEVAERAYSHNAVYHDHRTDTLR
jgi:hypothetical protein